MANKKTTEFDSAETLAGDEIVGIVQNATDVRTTIGLISNFSVGDPQNTHIGYGARSGEANNTIAIGNTAYARNSYGIAIGYHAEAGHYSIAIGGSALVDVDKGVAIGQQSHVAGVRGIAIGSYAGTGDFFGNVSIGSYVGTTGDYATAIGAYAHASAYGATAIGYVANAYSVGSVALGQHSQAHGVFALAMPESNALGRYSIAGLGGYAAHDYTVVFGPVRSNTIGSFVTAGPFSNGISATETSHKLVAMTTPDVKAQAGWGDGSYVAFVFYDTPGPDGNAFFLTLDGSSGSLDRPLSASFGEGILTIVLATDGSGNLNSAANTLADIAGLFPTAGFSFSFTAGFDATVVAFSFAPEQFANGLLGNTSLVMTADGNGPTVTNTPAMPSGTIANVTGTVIGWEQGFFGELPVNAATFVLSPAVAYRSDDGLYHLLGTPTFTIQNSTVDAAEWNPPALSVGLLSDVDPVLTVVVVDQNVGPISWMAFLKFESNQ